MIIFLSPLKKEINKERKERKKQTKAQQGTTPPKTVM